ncbi:MAG: glycosyltransferase family 87 protein [Thermoplasmatota archaeon]
MERELPMNRRGLVRTVLDDGSHRYIIMLSILYVAGLISTAVFGGSWGAYKGVIGLWSLAYLGLIYQLVRSDLGSRLERLDPKQIMVGIFLISLILHLPFLLQEPSLSQDIMRLERRGELLMDGAFPYRDFDVNKPPLYIWMVGLISLPLGPDQQVFRTIFVLANSLVPVMMLLIYRYRSLTCTERLPERRNGFNWFNASIAYVLCPIPLIEIGWGGHFDPVVVLITLGSFYFLLRRGPFLSGALLGTAFALKLYPLFIAPIFFLTFPKWRDRALFAAGFAVPTVLSALPLILVDPRLILDYLQYQFYGWSTGISIRGALEAGLDRLGLPLDAGYYIVTAILVLAVPYFAIRGMSRRLEKWDLAPVVLLMLLFAVLGTILQAVYLSEYENGNMDVFLGWGGTAIAIFLSAVGIYVFMHFKGPNDPFPRRWNLKRLFTDHIDPVSVPMLSSCILMVLMLTSAQFHTWYIIWALPFLFISDNSHFTWSSLMIFSAYQINGYLPWDI